MTRIVSIIGTDGSGKTTLSTRLVEQLVASGTDARHEWLGAESYLMAPVRRALKLAWDPRANAGRGRTAATGSVDTRKDAGYRGEVGRKNDLAARFPVATPAYVFLVMLDYRLQLHRKLHRSNSNDVVVADRYVFDVAVNLGLALGWTPDEVVGFLHRKLTRVRLPDARVFLRVEPEVSLSRKDDIPDRSYLALRLAHYDAIARAFGFEVLDGTQTIEELSSQVFRFARAELTKPHIHYVHSNNADVGGADKVLARMAQHMGARSPLRTSQYRTSVSLRLPTVALRLHEEAGTPTLVRAFERPQLSTGPRGVVRLLATGPRTYWYFRRLFALHEPDLVHVNDVYDFVPAMAARAAGVPVVYHLRMFQRRVLLRRLLARLIARCAASVSVSDAIRRHYFPRAVRGHLAEMIHDLGDHNLMREQGNLEETWSRPNGIPSGGRLITMVGRIEGWKGQAVFLEAIALLEPDVRALGKFVLVGGPVPQKEDYFAEVSTRARELNVVMLGIRSDVAEILRASDVSVHASIEPDPFPGVVVESLLAGTAVVASRGGGVTEMIGRSKAGVLVEPGNAADLSNALKELLEAPPSPRSRFAHLARARGLALVDPARIDAQLRALYSALLTPHREDLQ